LKVLDVNVVLAAHRDDHPDFQVCRAWLDRMLAQGASFAVVDLVAGAFLRIATNRRIFSVPTPVDQAFAYVRALRSQPSHVLLAPGGQHLEILQHLCDSADAAGDLIADAQLAAIAVEHAAEVVSLDRDFSRFQELSWERPGEGT
jgi:toxin-antitoxin system PIN domain toxin